MFLAGMLTFATGGPTRTFMSHLVLFRVGGCFNSTAEAETSEELCAVIEAKLAASWSDFRPVC